MKLTRSAVAYDRTTQAQKSNRLAVLSLYCLTLSTLTAVSLRRSAIHATDYVANTSLTANLLAVIAAAAGAVDALPAFAAARCHDLVTSFILY